ncbi:YwpF family protein [Sporosarcina siberiensis]|uniref:YwpF family protein n=1 Tax=Sporosarcina siberiensis TaxID=1365606 RepID=A0ABW4SIG1_9BACL
MDGILKVKFGGITIKTFKMLSVSITQEGQQLDIPLLDGIIINQENSHRMWILEMFIDQKHKELFEKWKESEQLIEAKVVISYPENEPAAFLVDVETIKQIGDNISVLLKGRLKRARSEYAEQLLEQLIEEDLHGAALLERFESDMKSRPRLKKDSEKPKE